MTSSSPSNSVLDYDGVGNTPKIIEQLSGYTDSIGITGAPAAEACANYTFPSGVKGYLPALGEFGVVYNNNIAVTSAMTLIGGTAIAIQRYWSSTQYNSSYSWYMSWISGNWDYYNKNNSCYVRAFAAL